MTLPLFLLAAVLSSASDPLPKLLGRAFELGQLGLAEFPDGEAESPGHKARRLAAAEELAALAGDPKSELRRAAVLALGKTAEQGGEAALLKAAQDADAGVRSEAALALFRMRLLKRVPEYSTAAVNALVLLAADPEPEVRWRALYAFSRWPEPRALEALRTGQTSPDPRARLFAAKALAKQGATLDPALSADADLYVRAEYAAAEGAGLKDRSAHVRAAAADFYAKKSAGAPVTDLVKMALEDSPLPRGQALLALAKIPASPEATAALAAARVAEGWWVRAKGYEAGAADETVARLGLADKDPRVAAAALEAFNAASPEKAKAAWAKVLRDPKAPLELLGTAVDIAAAAGPDGVRPLLDALEARAPGLTPEVRGSIRKALKAAAKAQPERAHDIAYALEAFPEATDRPRVFKRLTGPAAFRMKTAKGELTLELDAAAAPNHAAAFADSVARKLYDGTTWHRVVTAFVVQGGDPRGSGWGDDGWRLEDEPSDRPFLRGTVGMPKAGKDTGGCQLFVSLAPTPHLEGRYTVFGKVTAGLEVLDLLEPGDRIESVTAL